MEEAEDILKRYLVELGLEGEFKIVFDHKDHQDGMISLISTGVIGEKKLVQTWHLRELEDRTVTKEDVQNAVNKWKSKLKLSTHSVENFPRK